jgi:enoyl-CoA hydratase/carnithine racemase
MTTALVAPLTSERREDVLRLVLDRPAAANAIDDAMASALVEALGRAAEDVSVRAVVLAGRGSRAFCAGVDVKNPDGLDREALADRRWRRVVRTLDAVAAFDKPLVAAVGGAAVGAGAMLALIADAIVAAPHAGFRFTEIDIGMPTFLGLEILRGLAGEALAADLVLSSRSLSADEAHARGLVRNVVESEKLEGAAQDLARALAAKPPVPYALNKRWLAEPRRAALSRAAAESVRVRPLLHGADRPAAPIDRND